MPKAHGLTLVEMLIGMAITLVMMAAVVNLFANIGQGVRSRRAAMAISGELRLARQRLFQDLAGATCQAHPWQRPESDAGYLEIVEGFYSDKDPSRLLDGDTIGGELDYATSQVPSGGDPSIVVPSSSSRVPAPSDLTNGGGLGDYDDILALTVRSPSEQEPFRGSWLNPDTGQRETVTSTLAEVVWYAIEKDEGTPEPGMRTIYRRVNLIAPWLDLTAVPLAGVDEFNDILTYYADNDVSARIEGGKLVANTLGDLTKRENRYAHYFDSTQPNRGFPHQLATPIPQYFSSVRDRLSEDLMLSDALAFDVRVFDPGAPLRSVAGTVVEPSDAGWSPPASPTEIVGYGAYVDLGWGGYTNVPPDAPKPLFAIPTGSIGDTYGTWSFHYEHDGIDQDGDGLVDEGANGLDDDGVNGVDDAGEREAPPPYGVPLRGLQVTLRTYDRDTRQLRQATVKLSFVP